MVTGLSAGKTTITATANDGSNKKASITVNVLVPVSNIRLQPADDLIETIGYGKSATTLVAYGNTYGDPSEKNVEWDYKIQILKRVTYLDSAGYILDRIDTIYDDTDETDRLLKDKKLFVMKNGKVTAGSQAIYDSCNRFGVRKLPSSTGPELVDGKKVYTDYMYVASVSAEATDGSGSRALIRYTIGDLAKSIGLYGFNWWGRTN